MKPGFVYIITNKNHTTLYVGVTANILRRVEQHRQKINPRSFTARYNCNKLVYYEAFQRIGDAIGREKQLKAGSRAAKVKLIEGINPNWKDLYTKIKQEFEADLDEIDEEDSE
ncbi:GIY-YIG nuclease family protein [Flavobacteriaceae bacterium M23B6Z8]